MYCFNIDDKVVEKYNINIDKEELEKVKNEIVKDCSFIEHHEYTSDYRPVFDNFLYILNFTQTEVGEKVYFEETRTVYKYSYDEIKPVPLVELIGKLLDDDFSALEKIINYDVTEKPDFDEQISKEKSKLIKLIEKGDLGYNKKIIEDELERLINLKEMNKNRKPIAIYYKKVLELIKFEKTDEITMDEVNRISNFFEKSAFGNSKFINVRKYEKAKHLVK